MAAPSRFWSGITGRAREYRDALGNDRGCRSEFAIRSITVPIKFSDGTVEFPTNFVFPNPCVVYDAYVFVRTAEAGGTTKQINLGTATADSGSPFVFLNNCDVSTTGLKGLQNCQARGITVGASPFTYTAIGTQNVVVSGGTVSAITITRGGVAYTVDSTTDQFDLGDGDSITVTWSVVPTMTSFPGIYPDVFLSAGGKRISWTPASANFTTLDADIIINYAAFGDLTQFQTSGEANTQGMG